MKGHLMRHYTATGYVVIKGNILLHWHKKVKLWLPPGGHIEKDESPSTAVLREVMEETSLKVDIFPQIETIKFEYPEISHSPRHILIEDVQDPVEGNHQHIDLIYYCTAVEDCINKLSEGWITATHQELNVNKSSFSTDISFSKDVREIGMLAIASVSNNM
jgi:8-oxo-dGTP pyrophosphatase MutT (NUDIX family)